MRTLERVSRFSCSVATMVASGLLSVPSGHAQCSAAREFASFSGGKTGAKVLVDASAFRDNDTELAQFWVSGNPVMCRN